MPGLAVIYMRRTDVWINDLMDISDNIFANIYIIKDSWPKNILQGNNIDGLQFLETKLDQELLVHVLPSGVSKDEILSKLSSDYEGIFVG